MTPLNWAYIHVVLPVVHPETYGGLAQRMQHCQRRERLSLAQNREIQWQALIRLLVHSGRTTSFYQRRFHEAGINPEALSSPQDLEKIPPLTRDDIREHFGELRSNQFASQDLAEAATGGTTDTPVPILRARASLREKNAVQLCFNRWAGFLPGDKVFYLWGARQDFAEHPSWRWRLYDRYLMRQVWAPTSLFNESVLEGYRQSLNRFRPGVVYAYPTPLALFCEYLRASGKPFHRPASTICTAEPLFDHQRRVIEEVFAQRVFEHYGSREFAMIAGECEQHQGMHVNPAAAYVEFLPVEGAEIEGLHEILVTDLLNYGMPLIRYRVNDCVLQGSDSCPCGRGYPLVRQIVGRTTDVFYLPNGDVVPGVALTNRVLKVCPGLKKVQVVQETPQEFVVRYVPGPGFSQADLDSLRANLRKFFADSLAWTFEQVADIPRERSGKTRFCISNVGKASARGPGEPGQGSTLPAKSGRF